VLRNPLPDAAAAGIPLHGETSGEGRLSKGEHRLSVVVTRRQLADAKWNRALPKPRETHVNVLP
jgi:hypothetical protein